MRRALVLAASTLTIAACQAGTAMPTAGSQPPADAAPAFTNSVWPAVAEYNVHPAQGDTGSVAFNKIVDTSLDAPAWSALRDAIHRLGTVRKDSREAPGVSREERLTLASAELDGGDSTTATLHICYTYAASELDGANRIQTASEATVTMRKADNWRLRSITNDHVVHDCARAGKV